MSGIGVERDRNVDGSGLPFLMAGAVDTQLISDVADDPNNRRGRSHTRDRDRLVAAYRADGHDPQVWFVGGVVGPRGRSRANLTVVRCAACDLRNPVRPRPLPRSRYRGSPCTPVSAEQAVALHEARGRRERRVVLWFFAGAILLLGVSMIGALADSPGLTVEQVNRSRLVAVVVLATGAVLLLGAVSRIRREKRNLPQPGWHVTWWGRTAVVLGLVAVTLVATQPGPAVGETTIGGATGAAGCPFLRAEARMEFLGMPSVDGRSFLPDGPSVAGDEWLQCHAPTTTGGGVAVGIGKVCLPDGGDHAAMWEEAFRDDDVSPQVIGGAQVTLDDLADPPGYVVHAAKESYIIRVVVATTTSADPPSAAMEPVVELLDQLASDPSVSCRATS